MRRKFRRGCREIHGVVTNYCASARYERGRCALDPSHIEHREECSSLSTITAAQEALAAGEAVSPRRAARRWCAPSRLKRSVTWLIQVEYRFTHWSTGGPMADVNDVLAATRAAVIDFVAAAERSAATWTTPRAPGKWSPNQVVEHVARCWEESANVVSGAPSMPMPPDFLR